MNDYLRALPVNYSRVIAGKRLFMVHASPPDSDTDGIKLLDENGDVLTEARSGWSQRLAGFDHDVLVVGHTHQVFAEWLGDTLVINPGSSKFNHSCAVLSLPEMSVEWFSLGGQPIERSWNWGAYIRSMAGNHGQ